jgi:hypothetical protein
VRFGSTRSPSRSDSGEKDDQRQPSRSSRRDRAGSAPDNADRPNARPLPRAVPGRSAAGIRTRPARRSIAHRIQEKAYGGLLGPAQRQLNQLIKAYAAKPTGKLVLPPRIKAGSILVRQWKNKSYRVTVMAEGFAYEGQNFGNLSEIAQLITGTRWTGPRFFGLRVKQEVKEAPVRKPPLGGGSDYRKRNAELSAAQSRTRRRRHGL